MKVMTGDQVRFTGSFYNHGMIGRKGVVTEVDETKLYPYVVFSGGELYAVLRNEIHTFQDTLDEVGRVSEANNEEPDSLEEREYAAIVTLLNEAYAGDFNGVDADRVIEYIDKLRRNQ